MKVMISKKGEGYSLYIPKKDLEAKVTQTDPNHVFGGEWELENGLRLLIDPLEEMPKLPATFRAKKLP